MQWWVGGSESIQQVLPGRKLSLASSLAALIPLSRQDPDEIWNCLRDRSLYPKHNPDELKIHQSKTSSFVPVSPVAINPSDLDIIIIKSYFIRVCGLWKVRHSPKRVHDT